MVQGTAGVGNSKNRLCTLSLDMLQWRGVSRMGELICNDLKTVGIWLPEVPAKVGEELVKICPIGVCESEFAVLT